MQTKKIEKYFDLLWPICRSITGNGVRETLKILQEIIPLKIHEVPSGKKVFDWEIPKEWNIRDAYIITPEGEKICEFRKNNLHIVNYSVPVKKEISFEELNKHLHTIPDKPEAIPYITSYYHKTWGFCISYEKYKKLPQKGKYKVVIDSDLKNGSLTYGDLILKGKTNDEILFSTYICHPSMANNELSGPLITAFLYREIKKIKNRKYTYRFVFVPETIGAINYLHENGKYLIKNLKAGYVVTCAGDNGIFTYKKSRTENTLANRIAEHVLKYQNIPHKIIDFAVGGSDERQYCSPGFNLPVGSLMRTPYKEYKEYHTSLDNKKFISFSSMLETIQIYFHVVQALELNNFYESSNPFCEPQLVKRNLYLFNDKREKNPLRLLHFLAYADGKHDLISIAEKRKESIFRYNSAIKILLKENLITRAE